MAAGPLAASVDLSEPLGRFGSGQSVNLCPAFWQLKHFPSVRSRCSSSFVYRGEGVVVDDEERLPQLGLLL